MYKAHPDYEYTLLVKNEQQAEPIKAKYPGVKFVYGTLEQSDLIRDTCLDTDVVIRRLMDCESLDYTKLVMQTRPSRQITFLALLPSPKAWKKATRRTSQRTGFIHPARPF